ncbi:hypothetical protein PVAP13_2NG235103 [Panicum virgatum]|uniref:Uncharacterized protein n=1 Tax=Panicum virgatum TaxID=38727 RepID=A0A8T0VB27_PANVG|nr:hypothetical protein PVAP13_2NG235103 [Panicum virgatum]
MRTTHFLTMSSGCLIHFGFILITERGERSIGAIQQLVGDSSISSVQASTRVRH